MPTAVMQPASSVLADTTNTRRDMDQSPVTAKKRRHDGSPVIQHPAARKANGPKLNGSSQQKSHFEEEVLEKLTQDISGLKKANSEKDQQWSRPPLTDWQEGKDPIIFQQIDVEEGTLHGGKTTVRLFGTTEVRAVSARGLELY